MAATRSEAELIIDNGRRWWLIGDRLLPVIAGGSETAPEGTGGDSGEGDPNAGGGGEGGTGNEGETGDQDKPESGEGESERKPPPERKPGEDRGAFRARKARQEAEERAERAEKALEELQDKDRTDSERLSKRASKAETRIANLEPTVRNQAIQIAFLVASYGDAKRKPIPWVDAEDVLLLVTKELDGIKVGDDGEIDQDEVRQVVDDLAKRKPHLIRRTQSTTPSGGNVGGGVRTPQEISREELAKTYTALRSRSGS